MKISIPPVKTVHITVIMIILSLPVYSLNTDTESKNILIMHSYHQGLDWTDDVTKGILEVFKNNDENADYEFYFEYLDTKRNSDIEYFSRLIEFEKQKHNLADLNFDIIIASDNDALQFLVSSGEELFGDVPVVFCGINNFTPSMLMGKTNITGIQENIDYDSTLAIMDKLHPEKTKVLLIHDNTTTGIAIKEEIQKYLYPYMDHFNFEFYSDFLTSEFEEKFNTLGEDYLIYLLAFNIDRKGVFNTYRDIIQKIHKHSPVPIYSSWDFFFGKGVTGGTFTSGFSQGKKAGNMAIEILNGKSPQSIPVDLYGSNKNMFDYRELSRFAIDMKLLPENSVIINRPPSLLWKYRGLLSIGLTLFISFISFITFGIYAGHQKRKSKVLKKINSELDKEVQEAKTAIKTLSSLLPICANCKKIRDDKGYWNQLEAYFAKHSNIGFSHGICPDCAAELYPDYFANKDKS